MTHKLFFDLRVLEILDMPIISGEIALFIYDLLELSVKNKSRIIDLLVQEIENARENIVALHGCFHYVPNRLIKYIHR